ncbi:MAG TPA: (Fe-S)-binding protein [Vicinamibacterales bacterium]|nr:(Fe-S)-binding protein [Vicinamibacterales bacterium]
MRGRLRLADAIDLGACVRCGLCAESCHYYRTSGDARATPAYKVRLAGEVLRAGNGAGTAMAEPRATEWVDELFGRCSMCGRCTAHCTSTVNVAGLVRSSRTRLAAAGLVPTDLQATVNTAVKTGNSMGITREEWIETVQWLEEELRAETGDPAARLPIDQPGADFLYAVNPREPKFFPLSLLAAGAIFHAAGASWTLASDWFDLTNYGLFSGDDEAAALFASRLRQAMRRLGARALVLGECGHGFNANRWRAPEWLNEADPPRVLSVLELVAGYVREGRLRLDPSRNAAPVTLHDPCNLVRLGGIVEEPRAILSAAVAHWSEMTPHGEQNFCCGGGGGQLAMARFAKRRLAAGQLKAEQIQRTGAHVVAAPCHNCVDQLTDLNKQYSLGVQVKTVCELVAGALVWST